MIAAVYTGFMAQASVPRPSLLPWRRVPALALFVVCLTTGHSAAAQLDDDESAREQQQAANLFEAAEAAFAAQDYDRAARLFERANDKAPHASVAYNAAVSWDYAKQRARAADAYQLALTLEGLDPSQVTVAEQRLAELGLQLGYVHIAKPVGGLATVGRIERQPIPLRFYQEPGAYAVELETADGATTSTQIVVIGGQTLRVELNLVERPPPTSTVQPSTAALQVGAKAPPPAPDVVPSSTREVLGWVSIGVGVAAAGVAGYLGYQVLRNKEAYLKGGRRDVDRYDDHRALQAGTNVAWAASGVTGALGVVLLLTSPTFEF